MKRMIMGTIVTMIVALAPALIQAEEGMPGWDKTLEMGTRITSASGDLKLIAVGQGNAVFLFDDTGKQFFTLRVDKTAIPMVSPDGRYIIIQTEGTGESTRNVYLYTSEPKLLWSMRDLPTTSQFSGNSEYILFSSRSKGGAILMAVGNQIVWNKGPWEIKPNWKRMSISQSGEVIAFNQEGTFDREGKRIKQSELGPVFDLSQDGSLVLSQQVVEGKVRIKLSDALGTKKWELMIPADPAAGEEAARGVSINQDIDRAAMVGNGQGRGYLYLLDLSGKLAWAKADLPNILPGDMNPVKVTRNYVRVNTVEGPRVYDLQGKMTWKTPGPGYDCLFSEDGQRVIMLSGNAISYQGPGDALALGLAVEKAAAGVPAPSAEQAVYPQAETASSAGAVAQGETAPSTGAAEQVTQAVLPAPTTTPVMASPQVVTVPVVPIGETAAPEKCSCLAINIIIGILAVILTILVLFLLQRFLGIRIF